MEAEGVRKFCGFLFAPVAADTAAVPTLTFLAILRNSFTLTTSFVLSAVAMKWDDSKLVEIAAFWLLLADDTLTPTAVYLPDVQAAVSFANSSNFTMDCDADFYNIKLLFCY